MSRDAGVQSSLSFPKHSLLSISLEIILYIHAMELVVESVGPEKPLFCVHFFPTLFDSIPSNREHLRIFCDSGQCVCLCASVCVCMSEKVVYVGCLPTWCVIGENLRQGLRGKLESRPTRTLYLRTTLSTCHTKSPDSFVSLPIKHVVKELHYRSVNLSQLEAEGIEHAGLKQHDWKLSTDDSRAVCHFY